MGKSKRKECFKKKAKASLEELKRGDLLRAGLKPPSRKLMCASEGREF